MGLFDSIGSTGGGIVNAFTGNDFRSAADGQSRAAMGANDLQDAMWNQARRDSKQYREAGGRALKQMESKDFKRDFKMSDFQTDPGYQFRMDEANKAIERSAAARGGLNSGGTLKALDRYNQDYASGEYSNAYNRFNADRDRRFNRLSSLAGTGQTAVAQVNQIGQNYAAHSGENLIGSANAQAAGITGQAQMFRDQKKQNDQMFMQGAGMMMSDARVKKNIEQFDAKEMLESLSPYSWEYKNPNHGEGRHVGVMAQDLEKTPVGKQFVVEIDGVKHVDYGRMVPLLLASVVQLQNEITELRSTKKAV